MDAERGLYPESVVGQTELALANLTELLNESDLDLSDVVKTTIFLTDMGDFGAVNEIYIKFFGESRPARSTVGVAELPRVGKESPILIEIEAIAYRGDS